MSHIRRYTHVHTDRVNTKTEIVRLLEEGWWLDYFWLNICHSWKGLYIHSHNDTKKVIGAAKHTVCEMLDNNQLMEGETDDGTLIFLLNGNDDFLFV